MNSKYIRIMGVILVSSFLLVSCSNGLENKNPENNSGGVAKSLNDNPKKYMDKDIDSINQVLSSGNIDKAEQQALEIYKKNSESVAVLGLLGNIYNKKGDSQKAIVYLEKANDLSGRKDGNILFNLSVSYYSIDKVKSKEFGKKAMELLPDDENLKKFMNSFNIASANNSPIPIDTEIDSINQVLSSGNIDKAEQQALEIYKKNSESVAVLGLLGNIYNKKGDSQKAIVYLEKANDLSGGKDGNVLFNLGVNYASLDEKKSKLYLEKAIKLMPENENIKNFLNSMKK